MRNQPNEHTRNPVRFSDGVVVERRTAPPGARRRVILRLRPGLFVESGDECAGVDIESVGEAEDGGEGGVALAAFEAGDEGEVESGAFGEFDLAEVGCGSVVADAGSEVPCGSSVP